MNIRDYLRILRKRWFLVTVCLVLAVAGAAAATYTTQPIYEAETQLFVSTSQSETDNPSGLQQGGAFAQQRVKSYAAIVDSPQVTAPVVASLGLDMDPGALSRKIKASAPLDTVLINVTVTDPSAALAQRLANAVARQFTVVAADLERPTTATSSPVKVSVVREALLPEQPVSPRPKLNLALGLLVGLAVGAGGAVLREALDTSVHGVSDVQDALGLATLGVIAHDPDAAKRPLLSHADLLSKRAEAFRQLRTNLQFVAVDSTPRSIVFTSALPDEGKTTTTTNLAISLDQAGVHIILVEGDLRRPRLASYLGLEGAVGLTDVLVGRVALDDALQPSGQGSMQVLLAGPIPPNPSELLGSQQMHDLIRQLEDRCDLVLIDAPPLLPVTDAAVLSTGASGTALVVRAERTTREQASRAAEILRSVDAHLYGVVLNMVPTRRSDAKRYGYGYGYTAQAPQVAAPSHASGSGDWEDTSAASARSVAPSD